MPVSCGVCFRDVFLDEHWTVATKSPNANCYLMVTYNLFWENHVSDYPDMGPQAVRERLRIFIESVYYQSPHLFQMKLCFMQAAFFKNAQSRSYFRLVAKGAAR